MLQVLALFWVLCAQADPLTLVWESSQSSLPYRACKFVNGFIATAASTEVGHQSTISAWTSTNGKSVWSLPVQGTSGRPQLSTGNTFFGTVLPLEKPVVNYWGFNNNTPTFNWSLPANTSPSPAHAIVFSADGSKAFLTLVQGTSTQILMKDVGTGKQTNWSSGVNNPPLNTATTAKGEVVAVLMQGRFAVVDTSLGKSLYEEATGHGTSGSQHTVLCVSTTAQYVAYGSGSSVIIHSFNDWNKHVNTWKYFEPEMEIQSCAIGDSTLVLTYYTAGFRMQTKVVTFYLHKHHEPAWSWVSPQGDPNNSPSHTAITYDGSYFAVASWGTIYGTTPQLTVWSSDHEKPIASYIAKGSLYDVHLDYAHTGGKKRDDAQLRIVTCGKVGHKTVYGSEGKMYMLNMDED